MKKNEKSFQNYFMKIAKPMNYHRTSLTNGGGYPDITGFHGSKHSLVELKDLVLGKKGERKLRQYFEDSQPPWYIEYFRRGGKRLFVAFRIRNSEESSKWYGLLQMTPDLVKRLAANELRYSDIMNHYQYREYRQCTEMIKEIEEWI